MENVTAILSCLVRGGEDTDQLRSIVLAILGLFPIWSFFE
jgi:hypothetical protein